MGEGGALMGHLEVHELLGWPPHRCDPRAHLGDPLSRESLVGDVTAIIEGLRRLIAAGRIRPDQASRVMDVLDACMHEREGS